MNKALHLQFAPAQRPLNFAASRPWLAPLAGYSDLPFRMLCRNYGAAVCETEMVSAKGLLFSCGPTSRLLRSNAQDQPLVIQLFGADPECMASAVTLLRKLGHTAFDCNFGCPVRKVARQGAGAALMADTERALAIGKAMLAAARAHMESRPDAHVGFKLRLLPNGAAPTDLGRSLEDAGASWLCLHPRTMADGFGGIARHEETARLVSAVGIPVIASGDMWDAAAAAQCLAQTGAATVMYARGALRGPIVFMRHMELMAGGSARAPDKTEIAQMIRHHVTLARQLAEGDGYFRKMRSLLPRYARGTQGVAVLRQRLCLCETWEQMEAALTEFLENNKLADV